MNKIIRSYSLNDSDHQEIIVGRGKPLAVMEKELIFEGFAGDETRKVLIVERLFVGSVIPMYKSRTGSYDCDSQFLGIVGDSLIYTRWGE
tara:strand:+ start:276 stop:545 length:270 start_codon:yes stop_codon:yes gene_type:complete